MEKERIKSLKSKISFTISILMYILIYTLRPFTLIWFLAIMVGSFGTGYFYGCGGHKEIKNWVK